MDHIGTQITLLEAERRGGRASDCPRIRDRSGVGRLVLVSLSGFPAERLSAWRRRAGLPARVGVVCYDATRSSTAPEPRALSRPGETAIDVRLVSAPDDLTGLAIGIDGFLHSPEGTSGSVVVCVDSLTTLLQYVDRERCYRFLHTLTDRLRSANADAHFHLDRAAHGERTLRTVRGLFDATLVYDDATDEWKPLEPAGE